MKPFIVCAAVLCLLLATGCNQSPQKLLEAGNKYHKNKKYKEASILYRKAINKDKKNAEAYYREGLNLLDQSNPVEASKFLRRAIDLNPDNTDAEIKLADIYLSAYSSNPKRLKNLLQDIRDLNTKILAHDPHSFEGIRLRGIVYLAEDNKDKALESFAEANQIKPYSRALVGWYAQALAATNHVDEAEKVATDMIAHDKSWGPGYDFLFLLSRKQNNAAKAEEVLRERVRNDPSSPAAVTNLASYLLSTNRFNDAETVMRRVLDDKKSFPLGRQMMGDFYYNAKKFDQALEQYQVGAKEDEKDALHYQQRSVGAYASMGRREEAMGLAKDLAAKNPKDATTSQIYASMLLNSGSKADTKASLTELQKLVKNNGNDAMLHFDLSRAYLGMGEVDRSLAEAREAVRLQPRIQPARLLIAQIEEDRKLHVKALEQTEIILKANPDNPEAQLIRDRAWVGLNDIDRATPELEALVQRFPAMNNARLELAGVYLMQKQYAKATDQFDHVWKSNPPDQRGFLGLQEVKMQQGKRDEALQALGDLVEQNPKVLAYRYTLANCENITAEIEAGSNPARAKNLWQQAADHYKEILKTTPNSTDVLLRLGTTQEHLGQYEPALASFQQASHSDPSNSRAVVNQAALLELMGRTNDARNQYNKALGLDPENTVALNNLAFLAADTGDNLDQAMTLAERAKKKMPNNPNISDTLGYVYLKKNLNTEALRLFKEVVETDPANATFRYHLAMALLKQGDKQRARQEAEKALQNTSRPDEQNKIRSFVNQIG